MDALTAGAKSYLECVEKRQEIFAQEGELARTDHKNQERWKQVSSDIRTLLCGLDTEGDVVVPIPGTSKALLCRVSDNAFDHGWSLSMVTLVGEQK